MSYIQLNLSDEKMMMKLFPLYLNYEAEISHALIDEIFDKNKPLETFNYFKNYFSRGITTFIYSINNDFIGFVSFHVDSSEVPGYAKGYNGWGHLAEIYVNRNNRGIGIGKEMVKKVEFELLKLNINKLYLTDLSSKKKFWKSMGYIDTKKNEPTEGGIIFVKYL